MSTDARSAIVDRRKIKHDFMNDLNSLLMTLEALQMVREEPDEFAELVALMQSTINSFVARIDAVLKLIPDSADPS